MPVLFFEICVGIFIIQNSPLDAGDFTMDGEFLAESLGKDLLSNLTLGKDPNPWYFGLKAAAANGGCNLLALNGLVFPPEFSRTKDDNLDENPGDLTSTLIGVGNCKDLRLRLGESEFVFDKALLFGEYIFNFSSFQMFRQNFFFFLLIWMFTLPCATCST